MMGSIYAAVPGMAVTVSENERWVSPECGVRGVRKGGAADVATGKNLPRAVQYNHCKYKYTHLYIDTNTLKPLKLCSKCKE